MSRIGFDFRSEREAIIELRKFHLDEGVCVLAKRIRDRAFTDAVDLGLAAKVGIRPMLSILSVIRRFDRRGYYATSAA